MEIKKIYIDMDGVLADFDRGIEELCDMKLSPFSERTQEEDDLMWERMRNVDNFYDKLEPIKDAVYMFNELRTKFGDKFEILSAIPKPFRGMPTSKEDKIKWVRRLLSEDVVINIVYRAEKKNFCTGKDCVLIDDYGINIDEWEANGGTGVLFENSLDTLKAIEDFIRIEQ